MEEKGEGIPRVCHGIVSPASLDTHYQFSIKLNSQKKEKKLCKEGGEYNHNL